jgi:hypothetical protein
MRSAHPAEVNPTAYWRSATVKARSWIRRAARRCRQAGQFEPMRPGHGTCRPIRRARFASGGSAVPASPVAPTITVHGRRAYAIETAEFRARQVGACASGG